MSLPTPPRVQEARLRERPRRLGRLYADLERGEVEYESQRRKLESELARLTVPRARAAEAFEQFGVIQLAWKRATPQEKRSLGLALFEAIYFDLARMTIAEVVAQAPFRPWLAS